MKKSSLLMMYEFYVLLCLQILVVEEINTVVGHSVGDLKLPTTRRNYYITDLLEIGSQKERSLPFISLLC